MLRRVPRSISWWMGTVTDGLDSRTDARPVDPTSAPVRHYPAASTPTFTASLSELTPTLIKCLAPRTRLSRRRTAFGGSRPGDGAGRGLTLDQASGTSHAASGTSHAAPRTRGTSHARARRARPSHAAGRLAPGSRRYSPLTDDLSSSRIARRLRKRCRGRFHPRPVPARSATA